MSLRILIRLVRKGVGLTDRVHFGGVMVAFGLDPNQCGTPLEVHFVGMLTISFFAIIIALLLGITVTVKARA